MASMAHVSKKIVEAPNVPALAEAHVDWLLEILRPLLVTEFEHGYKHGQEAERKKNDTDR